MEIKLTDIPLHVERENDNVTIELSRQMLSIDFRRKGGALGAYLQFKVIRDRLFITVESAAPGSEPRTIEVDLSGERRARQ